MTSRERVSLALHHQETDRPPIDFGGTVVTCLDIEAYETLEKYLGLAPEDSPIIDYTMGTVSPSEAMMLRFHSDFRRVSLNVLPPDIQDDMFTSGFGIRFKRAAPHAYFDVVHSPLSDVAIEQLAHMALPDPDDPALYAGLRDKTKDLYENTQYAIIADFGVPGFYETSQKLRGYENLACDLLVDPEWVTALYDILLPLQKRYFKNYLDAVNPYAQVICYADDLGMQDRLQMSPDTYREMIFPYHQKIFSYIHSITDAKIMLHCCGSIVSIIPDLIEAGVDILNPVQTNAAGMDPATLKREFGEKIVFWGGVDEQRLLPNGTPREIQASVQSLLSIMGQGGGYVLAPSHNFQADTPPQNIAAMYDGLASAD